MKKTSKAQTKLVEQFYLDDHNIRDYLIPGIIFTLFLIASGLFFKIYQDTDIWSKMKVAGGNAFEFCEFNDIGNSIVQTANTWSNLGFLVVGLFLVFLGIKDATHKHKERANLLLKFPMFSILMGASILYLFLGSFFYHASVTSFFQMLDQTGMYAIVFSFMGYHLFRIMPTIKTKKNGVVSSHKLILLVFLIINFAFVTYLWDKVDVNIFFPAMFIVYIVFTFAYNKRKSIVKLSSRLVLLSLYVLMLSLSVWILDRQDVLCDPTSIFQGHALWHILNAVVLLFIYLHYRAENTLEYEKADLNN